MLPCGTRYHVHPPPIPSPRPCHLQHCPFTAPQAPSRFKTHQNNRPITHSRNPAILPLPRILRLRFFRAPRAVCVENQACAIAHSPIYVTSRNGAATFFELFPRHGNFFRDVSTPWKLSFHAVEKSSLKNVPKTAIPPHPKKSSPNTQNPSKIPFFHRFQPIFSPFSLRIRPVLPQKFSTPWKLFSRFFHAMENTFPRHGKPSAKQKSNVLDA